MHPFVQKNFPDLVYYRKNFEKLKSLLQKAITYGDLAEGCHSRNTA